MKLSGPGLRGPIHRSKRHTVNRLFPAIALLFFFAASLSALPSDRVNLPQCRGISVTPEMRETVRDAKEDPKVAFKKKHRKLPPAVACESAMWHASQAVRRAARGPVGGPPRASDATFNGTPRSEFAPVQPVVTPPLRDLTPVPMPHLEKTEKRVIPNELDLPRTAVAVNAPDVARQSVMGPTTSAPTATGVNFEGVGVGMTGYFPDVAPPDTNGRVGATQYVQWNNLHFAVWDKTGKLLYGPAAGNTLFKPLGGVCASHNDGDPVASYDILAGRWVLSQFVIEASPDFSHQCIAVSMTSDATGSWYLYDFVTDSSQFMDYPHMAVWPDGYYMAAHMFDAFGFSYLGGRIFVFEREKMLQGAPARMLKANVPTVGGYQQYGMLAADLDSSVPPPAGEAEFILGPDPTSNGFVDSERLAVTWGTTPSITMSPTVQIPVTPLPMGTCGGRSCVPEPSPASSYDYLDDIDLHFMYRLAYRNFGGSPVQESILATQTGSSSVGGTHDVLRWYEFRNAGSSSATPSVYQQSTYDPDLAWRWMGSIAMDKDHNIALGYSKSSTSILPGIYITGRLAGDVLNTMGTEATMQAGGGVQYGTGSRWGDYSSMTLDPIDQCTFWFTSEYYKSNNSWNWATKIASFKFPSCTPSAAWGTLSGTVTSCDTGAPLAGVAVTLSNGYSGATDAAGHYSVLVPAGSYSATAVETTHGCTTSQPATVGVTIESGKTATQDFCVSGPASITLNSFAVDDSVSGNNNKILNANECVNFNVTLKNSGCANDSGISATLTTSTAGVTITQANSNYADLAADTSGANATPFRFQTSNSFVCGTPVALVLNVTSASGNKSFNISLPTCAANQNIPSSSLGSGDKTQPDRISRDGVPNTCSGKNCTGGVGSYWGPFYYKTFNFTNPGATAACVTVKIDANCGNSEDIESAAYLGTTYDPTNLCLNRLGDSATFGLGWYVPSASYSFTVPAHSDFVVVVNTDDYGYSCNQFSAVVSGLTDLTPGPGPCCPDGPPTITTGGPTTFCGGGSVTLTSSANSGNQWYLGGNAINGATNKTYSATATGNYTVTTTLGTCTSAPSAATAVTVTPLPTTPTITPGGATTFCTGGSVTLTSSSASGNKWYRNGTAINGETNQTYNASTAGNYTVTTTANGCESLASAPVTVTVNTIPSTPAISAGGSTSFCPGGSVVLTSSAANGNQWYLNGNSINGASNQQYTAFAAGDYTVIVTLNGCSSTASAPTTVSISSVPTTPNITAGGPTTFCPGGSVTLTSDSASGNRWYLNGNPINGATNVTYNATASGDYTVVVTTAGCSSAASAPTTVTVQAAPPIPTINAGGPTSFCTGGSVTLTSSSATGNQWYVGGNPINGETNQQYVASTSGNYTVVVTAGACSSTSVVTTVTSSAVPATPTITPAGPTTFCAGGTLKLSSSSATGNQWYLNGNSINGATSQDYSATLAGDYTVIVTTGGCSSAASGAVTITLDPTPATPTISAGGATSFCTGGSVTLTSSSATGNQWYLNGAPINSATNQQYVATASGDYTVNVTTGNCTSTDSAKTTVTVSAIPAQPVITPGGPTTFCAGGSVTLTSSSASGNQWYLNGNSINSATGAQYVATAAGNYTVIVSNPGCSGPASAAVAVTVTALPATPTISAGGATTFCAGGSVTLTSSSASGNQWYLNGNAINAATNQQYVANASGNYTVKVTANGCTSAASAATNVIVNAVATTPTINAEGPTTFCNGSSVVLTSSSATGNQWYLNGNAINSATNQQYTATAAGNYTVTVNNGCSSGASAPVAITVNPVPATPTVTASGPTTFCSGSGNTLTLTSSSATGNQWYRNSSAINGVNGQTFAVTIPGDYMVVVSGNGCNSQPSAVTTVSINASPTAAITAPTSMMSGTSGYAYAAFSVGTYTWSITNGTIYSGGTGSSYAYFTAGAAGTCTLTLKVDNNGCSATKSADITVTPIPVPVTITSVTPNLGTLKGGTSITIKGSGFLAGATVTMSGGIVPSNVVRVDVNTITAKTPAHAAGFVDLTVRNTDNTQATLSNAFKYAQQFDPNGDNATDPADIFYLVNYIFTNGPKPIGASGMMSGDANGDGAVDPADVFYVVNYVFTGGPAPYSLPPNSDAVSQPVAGRLTLGDAVLRGNRFVVPVIYTPADGSVIPQAMSISIRNVNPTAVIRHLPGVDTQFAISRRNGNTLSYIAVLDGRTPLTLDANGSVVVAELEMASPRRDIESIAIEPSTTLLTNGAGTQKAAISNGRLQVQ